MRTKSFSHSVRLLISSSYLKVKKKKLVLNIIWTGYAVHWLLMRKCTSLSWISLYHTSGFFTRGRQCHSTVWVSETWAYMAWGVSSYSVICSGSPRQTMNSSHISRSTAQKAWHCALLPWSHWSHLHLADDAVWACKMGLSFVEVIYTGMGM